MLKDKEKVTIIISTENNKDTIEKAINSISKGIRPADQIVVANNDGTDGTYEHLCEILGAKPVEINGQTGMPPSFDGQLNDSKIKIFRKRKSTNSHTLNVAIKMLWNETTIFGFMDPRSFYAADKIAQSISIFNSNPSVACVVSDYDEMHDGNVSVRRFRPSFDTHVLLSHNPYDINFLVRPQIFTNLKRAFNEQLSCGEDYELFIRIASKGLIYHIPAPLHTNTWIEDIEDKKRIDQFVQKMIAEHDAKEQKVQ